MSNSMRPVETFDEWYRAENGESFNSLWCETGQDYQESIRELLRASRDYLDYQVGVALHGREPRYTRP